MILFKMFLYLVLTYCLVYKGFSQEPQSCSQFHYVDKLLEKMIRMEITVESYHKEITETNTEARSLLEEIKREREIFKNDIIEMKKHIKKDIDDVKDSLMSPNVVFKARTPKDKTLETGQTIVFTENMFNYGNGYDNTTGIFTAPASGTYLFTFHLCVSAKSSMHYGLMLNNVVHTSGLFYDKFAHMCYTANDMIPMHEGHKAWIQCVHSSPTLQESSSSTYNYWNTFSGMLVHK